MDKLNIYGLISGFVLMAMPAHLVADELGSGRPNIDPDATEPTPIESENTWWNELLEWFEYDND